MANQYIVDVSSYNGAVDWAALKEKGVTGGIIKIIRKDLDPDKQFYANQKAVEKLGTPWGVYNYSYATTAAKAKSDMKLVCDMLDKVGRKCFKYGIWFDIENDLQKKLSKDMITDILNAAKETVEARGYSFGIYTGLSFYKEHIDSKKVLSNNWWIARYYAGYNAFKFGQAPDEGYKPTLPQNLVAWQFTSSLQTAGLMGSEKCDVSLLYRLPTAPTKKEAVKVVKIGSARIDERGKTSGGAAGDQTGAEVSTQEWYLHKKGWVVLRPRDPAAAERIASAMEKACANAKIGYDQAQRNTLYKAAASVGFDPSKVTKKVETDCSALVRVCLAYAGIGVADFNTSSEKSVLLGSGAFRQLADVYSTRADYLRRGDVLVTKTKGHTVVVLSDGAQAKQVAVTKVGYSGAFPTLPARGYYQYGDGTKNLNTSAHHTQIKRVQALTNWITGAKLIIDGHYGVQTELAVKAAQKLIGEKADGKFGRKTLEAAKKYRK